MTSVIRNPEHKSEIEATSENLPGKLDVLVSSIDDVNSDNDAAEVLKTANPDYVVWSAGAGGKGGAERTFKIDRDACKHYIAAAASIPTIKKFLLVSYLGSRRNRPSWWNDEDWKQSEHVNSAILADYFKAKVAADEYLLAKAKATRDADPSRVFNDICLRPGTLSDEAGGENVSLGKIHGIGKVSRTDVARVAAKLLETEYRGWVDLLGPDESGGEAVDGAVERIVKEKVDCVDGEDLEKIYAITG